MIVLHAEHKSSSPPEDSDISLNVFSDLIDSSKQQRLLSIYSPTPEYDYIAIILLEKLRFHAIGGYLDWIQNIHTCSNKIIQKPCHRSAGVIEVFQLVFL